MPCTRTFLRYWLPALAWLAAVILFAGETFGASTTGAFLHRVVQALGLQLSEQTMTFLHFAVRKCAHVYVYSILSALWFRAWRGGKRGWQWSWALLALGVCLAAATGDETRQSLTPGRTGDPWDVALDMSGATLAQLVIAARLRR